MQLFKLDRTERAVFDKLEHSVVHCGIVAHPSLPMDVSIVNIPAAGAPTNCMALPKLDFNARFDYMGGNSTNWRVLMVGKKNLSKDKARGIVNKNFEDMVKQGTLPRGGPAKKGSSRPYLIDKLTVLATGQP